MNILYITSSFDPHTALWVKHFTSNHNVVLFSDKKENSNKLLYPKNMVIIEKEGYLASFLNKYKIENQKLRHADMLLSIQRFVNEIKNIIIEYNIDIIHAHSLYYGFLASFIPKTLPVVFTPMGSDVIIYAQESKIHNKMARKAFKRADVITGDSKILQSQGYKVGAKEEDNYIIQNGVDTTLFYPQDSDVRKKLGINDDTKLIFSPRAIAKVYNIDEILKSLVVLKEKKYKFKCMFTFSFGNEHYDYLKSLVVELGLEDYVIWLGYIDYNDMADYYNAADIVVSIPSSDSSPKSVYEAMFCAKPVIVSNLPWSHEFLEDRVNILRTEVHNIEMLSKKIIELIENKELYNTLVMNAPLKADELYSYEKNMMQMESIMLDLINRYKGC